MIRPPPSGLVHMMWSHDQPGHVTTLTPPVSEQDPKKAVEMSDDVSILDSER